MVWYDLPFTGNVGAIRYVFLRVVTTEGVPVPGLMPNDFNIIFQRSNVNCLDPLTFIDRADGRYTVTYVPSSGGWDHLEIMNFINDIGVIDELYILGPIVPPPPTRFGRWKFNDKTQSSEIVTLHI